MSHGNAIQWFILKKRKCQWNVYVISLGPEQWTVLIQPEL